MFYFNSWFVYAIYYVLALIAAASLSDIVESAAARWKRLAWGPTVAAVLCLLGIVSVLVANRALYHDTEYADAAAQAQARTVVGALAARQDAPRGKLLVFPHEAWGAATGVAALLTRLGYPAYVDPDWHIMFGEDHSPAKLLDDVASDSGHGVPLDIWWLVPRIKTSPVERASAPLVDGYVLRTGLRELDPTGPDAEVRFLGPQANADAYVLTGWADAGPGAEYTLSVGKRGLIVFRPGPVAPAASVEMSLVFTSPWLWPPVRESQRLTVRFNGHALATTRVAADTPLPLRVSIPATIWNELPTAMLEMDFPDAISPVEVKNGSNDPREFAFCTDRFTFHVAGQEAAPGPTPKVSTTVAP